MHRYVVLIRGINVGGKNKIAMPTLAKCLEELGYYDVTTYIASGNVILSTDQSQNDVKVAIEQALPTNFKLDSELIKVLVLDRDRLKQIVDRKPKGFAEQPDKYYSDVIFLIDIDTNTALGVFDPREGVDQIWAGDGVIYSQRLGALRTTSRLSKIVGSKEYKSMTIRTWNTTTKLLTLLESH